jgi:hypothetical protein
LARYAGILINWIPAFAGMTHWLSNEQSGLKNAWIPGSACGSPGMTGLVLLESRNAFVE